MHLPVWRTHPPAVDVAAHDGVPVERRAAVLHLGDERSLEQPQVLLHDDPVRGVVDVRRDVEVRRAEAPAQP